MITSTTRSIMSTAPPQSQTLLPVRAAMETRPNGTPVHSLHEHVTTQPENPFAAIVANQNIALIPEFELESGEVLHRVPVAYKTWGKLNERGDNAMIICHAFTGSADASDWWGPLLGKNCAFDPSKFFIVCLNSLGSPYGSASPVTLNPHTNKIYGPEFPICTVRDDVRIHRLVLDALGVKRVAACIGGSMGGMLVLEWAMYGVEYVRCIVPLATSARNSAWCISWGEAQRQCIYSDPKYDDGYYSLTDPPISGLSAARMSALLTYRSRNSFESRFGRDAPQRLTPAATRTPNPASSTAEDDNVSIHNDGMRNRTPGTRPRSNSNESVSSAGSQASRNTAKTRPQHYFTAQSYLRYQGEKFISRFDSNCYIAITRKLDTHDLSRDRPEFADLSAAVKSIKQPALVIGITSDGLFTYSEQVFLARHISDSQLHRIESMEGHDAFLLEFKEINDLIVKFLGEKIPDIVSQEVEGWELAEAEGAWSGNSVFGEAEDVTQW